MLPIPPELIFGHVAWLFSSQSTNSVQTTAPRSTQGPNATSDMAGSGSGTQIEAIYGIFPFCGPPTILGDGTCQFSTLVANAVISAALYSTHGPSGRNEWAFPGVGSYILRDNGQTPPFAPDVGFRPDFGRRSGVFSPQHAES